MGHSVSLYPVFPRYAATKSLRGAPPVSRLSDTFHRKALLYAASCRLRQIRVRPHNGWERDVAMTLF
jgi:hypothetical protein